MARFAAFLRARQRLIAGRFSDDAGAEPGRVHRPQCSLGRRGVAVVTPTAPGRHLVVAARRESSMSPRRGMQLGRQTLLGRHVVLEANLTRQLPRGIHRCTFEMPNPFATSGACPLPRDGDSRLGEPVSHWCSGSEINRHEGSARGPQHSRRQHPRARGATGAPALSFETRAEAGAQSEGRTAQG
jgi:hypothetical protein